MEGELQRLFGELMELHYDPHYQRSQSRHFIAWASRHVVPANDLSEDGIAGLADHLPRSGSRRSGCVGSVG